MTKLAIIGASYLQLPLIEKAKQMGIETHVFAWKAGDVGETAADFFYPISIIEKDEILAKCREIGIDGITSIASDLAIVTVNYVANALGLIGNSLESTYLSTNKHQMRLAFEQNGDPSPRSILVHTPDDFRNVQFTYPVVVKPLDRSGSRGITKLMYSDGLEAAIEAAKQSGFEKAALVEEFATGQEYSVECVSWQGKHYFLAMTYKYTTGAPHFIETAHLQPAPVSDKLLAQVQRVVFHALDSLQIEYGASHSEIKVNAEGEIKIIEIGARMGGDFIGSNLVQLSTGFDFVKAVIMIALGQAPKFDIPKPHTAAAVRFALAEKDLEVRDKVRREHPEYIVYDEMENITDHAITDSSSRFGAFILCADCVGKLISYMPEMLEGEKE